MQMPLAVSDWKVILEVTDCCSPCLPAKDQAVGKNPLLFHPAPWLPFLQNEPGPGQLQGC